MKKICFLMYTPFRYGGIERVVSVISNGLVSKDFDVSIMCFDSSVPINREMYNLNEKVKIIFLKQRGLINKLCFSYTKILRKIHSNTNLFDDNKKILKHIYFDKYKSQIEQIISIINDEKYDYVIGANGLFSMILGMIKDKITSKVIGWQHSSFNYYFYKKGFYYYKQDLLAKEYFSKLDNYINLLNYDHEEIKRKFNINSVVIPNPVSFESDVISNYDSKSFISVGRFVEAKGYDLLIDAFNEFSKLNKDWILNIYGDGELKEKIKSKIIKYGLEDRVFLKGFTNDPKKNYLESSIYLLSSKWEGFGLSAIEAMECGLPVISFDIPAMKDILSFSNGELLVNSYDILAYAKKMNELSSNINLIKKYGKMAKENNKKYDIDNIIKLWIDLLK